MNIQDFHKYGTHFCNLSQEQIEEKFDFVKISELQNNKNTQRALLLLSQYVVGNISETFNEIKSARIQTRKDILEVWFEIVKDPDELRAIGKLVVETFI